MHYRAALGVVLVLALASLGGGCASTEVLDINKRLVSLDDLAKKPADATYVVDPPDAIRVEFLSADGPPARDLTVRSDGCVTLPFVEDVEVAGMTTLEIRTKLESLYERFYRDPQILVSVIGYNSKHVYVYGEVGRQGRVPYTGTQTVSDVIGAVGGFTYRAAPTRVRVVRGDPKRPDIFRVNLKELIYEGDLRQEVSLAENDVVRVPPNALAWVGYQLDLVLWPFRSAIGALGMGQTVQNTF